MLHGPSFCPSQIVYLIYLFFCWIKVLFLRRHNGFLGCPDQVLITFVASKNVNGLDSTESISCVRADLEDVELQCACQYWALRAPLLSKVRNDVERVIPEKKNNKAKIC